MELKNAIISGLVLAVMAHTGMSSAAMPVEECVAERYKQCPFF